MFSHVTVGTTDIDRATGFYDALLIGVLDWQHLHRDPHRAGYGRWNGPQFWVLVPFDGQPASAGNGVHIAFLASSRDQVDRFHAAALAHGGADEGAPGPRPHYHENYYGGYVRDPDGNKLQAVCHSRRG